MSRDGSGNYSRAAAAPSAGQTISSTNYNAELNDIASALTASVGRPQSAGASAGAAAGGGSRRGGGGETAPMPPKFVKPPPDEVQAPTPSSSACASAEPKPKPEPEPAAPVTVVAAPEGEFSFEDMVRQSGGASVV